MWRDEATLGFSSGFHLFVARLISRGKHIQHSFVQRGVTGCDWLTAFGRIWSYSAEGVSVNSSLSSVGRAGIQVRTISRKQE